MNNLFDGCNKLKKSDISKWKIKGIVNELKSINDSDQTTLNINNEILLKDFNMKYNLKIKDSKINKINIGNRKLRDELLINLCKIEFNELKELYLGFNKIADIKILEKAKFDKLEILNLSHNQIKNKRKLNIIKYNKRILVRLNINKEEFEIYIGLKEFNNKYNTNIEDIDIKVLNLSNRYIGNEGLKDLIKIKFKGLNELDLSYNEISNINMLQNSDVSKLTVLNLGFNNISDINIFKKVNFAKLTVLNLCHNEITNINILKFVNFDELKELDLSFNNIPNINALEKITFKKLEVLNLSGNGISNINI